MSTSFVLSVILACFVCLSFVNYGQAFDSTWRAIEKALTENGSPDNSPADNLRLLLDLFAEEISAVEAEVSLEPSELMKRIIVLRDFQKRIDFPLCDEASYSIRDSLVTQNSRFIKYPRTQEIVMHQAYELAKACQKQHAVIFRREIEFQNTNFPSEGIREYFNYLRPFFAKVIYATIMRDENSLAESDYNLNRLKYDDFLSWSMENPISLREIYSRFILSTPWTQGIKTKVAKVALNAMMSIVNRVKIEDKSLVERIVAKLPTSLELNLPGTFFYELIVRGCRKFVGGIGEEVFLNAQKDVKYLGYTIIEERSKNIADYYYAWASYRACWHLIYDVNVEYDLRSKMGEQADLIAEQTGQHPANTTLLIYEELDYMQAKEAKTV